MSTLNGIRRIGLFAGAAALGALGLLGPCVAAAAAASVPAPPDPFGVNATVAASPAGNPIVPCAAPQTKHGAWTLTEIVDGALCNNPQTRQAWANAKVFAAQVGVARAPYLPNISVSVAAQHQSSNQGITQNAWSPALSINYLLFDFGGRDADLEAARQALAAANWSQDATLQDVALAAIQAYYQLFASQQALVASREAEKAAREGYDAARFRHKVGAATIADTLQAQTAYSQATLNRQTAEGALKIAQGTLANVLGLDADTRLDIVAPKTRHPNPSQERNVRNLIEEAKRSRPDLAAAEAQVAAANAHIKSAEAAGKPTISLFANQGYNYLSQMPDTRSTVMGIQVAIPIFTGFSNTYQVEVAKHQSEAQQAQRDLLSNQVALDVWQSYQSLKTTENTLATSADVLTSARQAEEVALGQYKAGAGTILNLLTAQASLASARLQNIQSQYNWFTAKAALGRALGRLEPGYLTGDSNMRATSTR